MSKNKDHHRVRVPAALAAAALLAAGCQAPRTGEPVTVPVVNPYSEITTVCVRGDMGVNGPDEVRLLTALKERGIPASFLLEETGPMGMSLDPGAARRSGCRLVVSLMRADAAPDADVVQPPLLKGLRYEDTLTGESRVVRALPREGAVATGGLLDKDTDPGLQIRRWVERLFPDRFTTMKP